MTLKSVLTIMLALASITFGLSACSTKSSDKPVAHKSKQHSKHGKHHKKFKHACSLIKQKRYKEAHKHLKALADKGHGKSQTLVAMLYEKGVGVEKDTEKAIAYYEKAASQGIPQAQSNLGHLMLNMERDSEVASLKAADWLKKAASHGIEEAEFTLKKIEVDVENSPLGQNEVVWQMKDAAQKSKNQVKSIVNKIPKPASSALGNPAKQVSAGVQGLAKSWQGYGNLANSINHAAAGK